MNWSGIKWIVFVYFSCIIWYSLLLSTLLVDLYGGGKTCKYGAFGTKTGPFRENKVNGPFARYVKSRVAHAPGMPGTFSSPPRVSDPDMHHGTCVTHVAWYMPESLTSGFLWSRWRRKHSRHSHRTHNPWCYISGKGLIPWSPIRCYLTTPGHQWPLSWLCGALALWSYFFRLLNMRKLALSW